MGNWKSKWLAKSPFRKKGGDPPEKNITTSYTYEPGDNTAASRFNSITGGVGNIEEKKKSDKGKKTPQGRHVSVKI